MKVNELCRPYNVIGDMSLSSIIYADMSGYSASSGNNV